MFPKKIGVAVPKIPRKNGTVSGIPFFLWHRIGPTLGIYCIFKTHFVIYNPAKTDLNVLHVISCFCFETPRRYKYTR